LCAGSAGGLASGRQGYEPLLVGTLAPALLRVNSIPGYERALIILFFPMWNAAFISSAQKKAAPTSGGSTSP
jgi:hypothetical protein